MNRLLAIVLVSAWALLAAAPAAEAACPRTSLLDIQDEVMCVICGTPLVNAGGPQSDNQRDFIRERAAKCETKEEIKHALVAEYGPEVLAMPQKSGFDLTAYLVPLIALGAALGATTAGALRWRRNRRPEDPAGESVAADPALDDDLRKYDL